MGDGQNPSHPDTNKRQKPITPVFSSKKAQGLMFFDFLRPNDSLKIREPLPPVNGFCNFFQYFFPAGKSLAPTSEIPHSPVIILILIVILIFPRSRRLKPRCTDVTMQRFKTPHSPTPKLLNSQTHRNPSATSIQYPFSAASLRNNLTASRLRPCSTETAATPADDVMLVRISAR
jgi:hypothetical protein